MLSITFGVWLLSSSSTRSSGSGSGATSLCVQGWATAPQDLRWTRASRPTFPITSGPTAPLAPGAGLHQALLESVGESWPSPHGPLTLIPITPSSFCPSSNVTLPWKPSRRSMTTPLSLPSGTIHSGRLPSGRSGLAGSRSVVQTVGFRGQEPQAWLGARYTVSAVCYQNTH